MFKISDEDIMSFVRKSFEKEAKERGLLKEAEEGQREEACRDIKNYPTFNMTNAWGRLDTRNVSARSVDEAKLVRSIFDQAFAGIQRFPAGHTSGRGGQFRGKSPQEKIRAINDLVAVPVENLNPVNGLAYIVAIDTLLILKSSLFEPTSAGFLNESFMSALLSGTRVGNRTIEDIRIFTADNEEKNPVPYSLKFVNANTARSLSGSFRYLANFFNAGEEQITYIVALKPDMAGGQAAQELTFYTFVVKRPLDWEQLEDDLSRAKSIERENPSVRIGMKKVKVEDTEVDQPARFYFSLFPTEKREAGAEPFLRLTLPTDEGLREKAQIVLGAYNEYLSQIYEDLEYIRCYTDNYLVNGRRDYADKAVERSAALGQNIKRIYSEGE